MDLARYNYYDILEISPLAPQHEITAAYEKAKSTYSGDNPAIYTLFTKEEAKELLVLVEEAYSVLGNQNLRSLYDEKMVQKNTNTTELSFTALKKENQLIMPEAKKNTKAKEVYALDEDVEKIIKEEKDWDGPLLKKIREYKKISIDKMNEITKISPYYVHAIENMDQHNLPAVVFVRGYVAQIAKTLSLDEKTVCDGYMKKFREQLQNK